ncbi:MAG TPA: hypothetical protein PLB55_18025 [Prosthecobacter sp.]|jgi:hypothetical protein|nr:hypothetical protein [Prosthecobacter sp.]
MMVCLGLFISRPAPDALAGENEKQALSFVAPDAPLMPEGLRCSMFAVIARPEQYDGKLIAIEGTLVMDFKQQYVCCSRESALKKRWMDGVWLDLTKLNEKDIARIEGLSKRDGKILGRYTAKSEAPYRWSAGTIQVERLLVNSDEE